MSNGLVVFKEKLDMRGVSHYQHILPPHVDKERFVRCAFAYAAQNPKILQCDERSLFMALLTAAQLGLCPESATGESYLVPFKNKVQFIPGYRGLMKLAWQSGQISHITRHCVYEGDTFVYNYGLYEECKHVPAPQSKRGELTHAYAIAHYKTGGYNLEVKNLEELIATRNSSAGYSAFKSGAIRDNPWNTHFPEMCEKTVIRSIGKMMPLSPDLQRAISIEDNFDNGKITNISEDGDVVEENIETIKSKSESLNEMFVDGKIEDEN